MRTLTAAASILILAASAVLAPAQSPQATDVVIFHNGRTVEGKVLKETATEITMLVIVGTMSAEMTYPRSEILSIQKGAIASADATPEPAAPATVEPTTPDEPAAEEPALDGAERVYHIELTGRFGRDISQTPLRNAVDDARARGATYLIVEIDSQWSRGFGEDLGDDAAAFDELYRATDLAPIFMEEIRREWDNPPTVVFWVKNAMGGAAFLPLVSSNIYFHSDGRMGGIGNLAEMFQGTGDEVVGDKQRSLREGAARGLAIHGGHDTRIVEAMTKIPYELWLRFERGRPVLIDDPDEVQPTDILLTDDGQDDRADTEAELVRGEGNDALTLRADIAYQMGFSKGTADTLDDLLFQLGIDQNAVVLDEEGDQIAAQWRRAVDNAERQLQALWQDYGTVQAGGDYQGRTRARGQQTRILEQMERLLNRFGEAIVPGRIGVPDLAQIEQLKNDIRFQQLADRP